MRNLRINQAKVIEHIEHLGYKIDRKGMCFGIAAMGMQAILSRDVDTFNKRILLIGALRPELYLKQYKHTIDKLLFGASIAALDQFPVPKFPADWPTLLKNNEARKKLKIQIGEAIQSLDEKEQLKAQKIYREHLSKQTALLPHQKDILNLNIPAFFEGVVLYHLPPERSAVSNISSRLQDVQSSAPFALSSTLEAQQGMEMVTCFNGSYDAEDLKLLFDNLRKKCDQTAPPAPVSFMLDNVLHAISVGYDPALQKFIFIDANDLPAILLDDSHQLAEHILRAYSKEDQPAKAVCLQVEMFVSKQNALQIKPLIAELQKEVFWKNMHAVTDKNAFRCDGHGVDRLLIAAESNDIETLKSLLEIKLDPNKQVGPQNKRALLFAVNRGHTDVVKLLLEKKANPDIMLTEGDAPLHNAVQQKQLPIIQLLIAAKADPNTMCFSNQATPLAMAVDVGPVEAVQLLLKAGASPNLAYKGEEGVFVPPIVDAVERQNLSLVSLLLKANAISDIQYPIRRDAVFMLADQPGNQQKTQIINKLKLMLPSDAKLNANPLIPDFTLLHAAIISNNKEMVQLLLDHAVSNGLNLESKWAGRNAYELAMTLGLSDIAKTILEFKLQTAVKVASLAHTLLFKQNHIPEAPSSPTASGKIDKKTP